VAGGALAWCWQSGFWGRDLMDDGRRPWQLIWPWWGPGVMSRGDGILARESARDAQRNDFVM
jgi:hypothetical protein